MLKTMRQIRRMLYTTARIMGDVNALASGDSRTITRRAKNKLIGRLLGQVGVWSWLWR